MTLAIYGFGNRPCCNNVNQSTCPDQFGCDHHCPDFVIRRHDTKPHIQISVSDCNGPLDLSGPVIAEMSMWAKAKLKKNITDSDTFFGLADNVGFQQIDVGDIIVMDRVRNPEQMLVTGFDENLKLIQVQRGYNGSQVGSYHKGSCLRIFRVLNAVAETETVTEDVMDIDGSSSIQITDSRLVYNWQARDTCMPGCFYAEFKLLRMVIPTASLTFTTGFLNQTEFFNPISTISCVPSIIPSFVPSVSGCDLGAGVEWVRRFPLEDEGFRVKIWDTGTAENVI
jgi:hypothetical protein